MVVILEDGYAGREVYMVRLQKAAEKKVKASHRVAEECYKEHGSLDMPSNYIVNGVWLAKWIREQYLRLASAENNLSKETRKPLTKKQKEQLSSIGINETYKTKAEID